MAISHFVIFPTLEYEICTPGDQSAWSINAVREKAPERYAGTVGSDRDVSDVLSALQDAYPETEGRVAVRWLNEAGTIMETKPGTPSAVMDELMEVISDETPDEADTTDDHPLEEARSFLLEFADLRNDSPEP